MVAPDSRVASASSWLTTCAYAYLAFVASTKLVTTAVRWGAALIGACVAYVLVMLALAAFWQRDSAHAAVCCAAAMAVSVLCGAWVANVILLPGHRHAGAWACLALGMFYPVMLAASSPPAAPVHAMVFLYVVASAVGGVTALWTLPVMRGHARISHTAHA